jgi:AcrR family transcriptional regulator
MTPRPRKASDQDVFAATQRVMMRVGPGELTLAEIAREAGVTAGALVQRFGSKRDLLLALMATWSGSVAEEFAQFRSAYDSPLEALYGYGECLAQMGGTPAEFAHHLSYLQLDLTDPAFHRHVKRQAVARREELQRLLDDAVAAGELSPDVDTRLLARQVEVTMNGSLWTWVFHQEGTATRWMREDLGALLQRWEVPGQKRAKSARPGRVSRSHKKA